MLSPTDDVLDMDKRIQAKLKEKVDKAKGEKNATTVIKEH
jgi:hypothetical protein